MFDTTGPEARAIHNLISRYRSLQPAVRRLIDDLLESMTASQPNNDNDPTATKLRALSNPSASDHP